MGGVAWEQPMLHLSLCLRCHSFFNKSDTHRVTCNKLFRASLKEELCTSVLTDEELYELIKRNK